VGFSEERTIPHGMASTNIAMHPGVGASKFKLSLYAGTSFRVPIPVHLNPQVSLHSTWEWGYGLGAASGAYEMPWRHLATNPKGGEFA